MTVLQAFETSIAEAVKDGHLEQRKHGAIIEAARTVAAKMDAMEKNDIVSAGTFLKYCDALGIVPESAQHSAPKKKTKLTAFGSGAKFSKVENG